MCYYTLDLWCKFLHNNTTVEKMLEVSEYERNYNNCYQNVHIGLSIVFSCLCFLIRVLLHFYVTILLSIKTTILTRKYQKVTVEIIRIQKRRRWE